MSEKEITAIIPRDMTETKALAKDLSMAQLLPQALKQKPADVLAIVLTGQELGLAPMQAIRGIHIIDGKASLSSDLMGALVKRSPLCEFLTLVESNAKIATYKAKRKGEPGETTMSFTIEEARAAGLTSKNNWAKYPAAMLRARCQAIICRAVFPDLCLGLYDEESGELERVESATVDTTQKAHVESVKEQLKAEIAPPKPDVVDAEFVEAPKPDFKTRILEAPSRDALKALLPEIQAHVKSNPADRESLLAAYGTRTTQLEGK